MSVVWGRGEHPINKICVVRLGGMGDILLATPAVRALAQHFGPDTQIDFVVGRGMKPALDGISYLNEIIEFDKDGDDARPGRLLQFLNRLHTTRYDLFVNFHPSVKTTLMGWASGAHKTLVFHKDRRKQTTTGRVRHAVDDFTKELTVLGIGPVTDRKLDFWVPPTAQKRVADLLCEMGIEADDLLLVVNPAATREVNRWPEDRFVAFFERMARELPSVRLVLTGGPGDRDLAARITRAADAPVVNVAGQVSVKELGALLQRANVVLTADTGPMHIASAVGSALVVLSGAADPDRTGPLSPRDLVVINRELSCVPCQARTCKRGDIACMTQMPVDWVFNAVSRRLASVKVAL